MSRISHRELEITCEGVSRRSSGWISGSSSPEGGWALEQVSSAVGMVPSLRVQGAFRQCSQAHEDSWGEGSGAGLL